MGIQSFGNIPVAGGSNLDPDQSYYFQVSSGVSKLFGDGWSAGMYVVNTIPLDENPVTPSGIVGSVIDLEIVETASLSDSEVKGGIWSGTATLDAQNDFSQFYVNLNIDALVRLDYYSPASYLQESPVSLAATQYTTTGDVTLTAATNYVAIIGGGGGGQSSSNIGGGGGGSGYITSFTRPAGTYSLVVGSGGAGATPTGGAGGTTTFDGETAAGGSGGTSGNSGYGVGGAGGSSGSGGTYNWVNVYAGINGGTGLGGAGGASGAGSGVLQPIYTPGGIQYATAGQAGSFYGGGNGTGTLQGPNESLKNAADGTGGGGGGGKADGSAGSGGTGSAYVLGVN